MIWVKSFNRKSRAVLSVYELLTEWNKVMNLDCDHKNGGSSQLKHFIDSLSLFAWFMIFRKERPPIRCGNGSRISRIRLKLYFKFKSYSFRFSQ